MFYIDCIMVTGAVVKRFGSAFPELYYMKGGSKVWIPDMVTFRAMGLSTEKIVELRDAVFHAIPTESQAKSLRG